MTVGSKEANKQAGGGDVLEAEDTKVPINILLETKPRDLLKLTPRRYQTELCNQALDSNVIVHLGTGLGKTFIVVMLVRSPLISERIRAGRKVVFLTPTQDLTRQQAEYINLHVVHRVRVYCGRTCQLGTHIDHWSKQTWDEEMARIDIMVMTPQIFSSAVSGGLLEWPRLGALVLDECHHAVGRKKSSNHPYAQIMRHYEQFYRYNSNSPRPRIVGLTASLVNNMPKCGEDIADGIVRLESILDARCITDLEVQESRPTMVIDGYSNIELAAGDIVCDRILRYQNQMKEILELKDIKRLETTISSKLTTQDVLMLSYYNRLKLAASGISIKPASFPKVLHDIVQIRKRTGLWTTREICSSLVIALEKHVNSSIVSVDLKPLYKKFMEFMSTFRDCISEFICGSKSEELRQFTQPKLIRLLEILQDEYQRTQDGTSKKSSFSCIVFVHSRLEVVALNKWLKEVSASLDEFKFLKSDYAVGLASASSSKYACIVKRKSTEQARMLEEFRRGNLNVIVTTSVLEEGIDLPVCSTVIRYDPAKTFRIYVQSRGRARQKISSYITMCEIKNLTEVRNELQILNDFEYKVKKFFTGERDIATKTRNATNLIRNADDGNPDLRSLSQTMFLSDSFMAQNGKLVFWATNARIVLFMYGNKFERRHPYTDGIRYDRVRLDNGLYITTIYLPPGCPIQQGIQGNARATEELAEDSAIVATFKALYEAGELDEHGVPIKMTQETVQQILSKEQILPKREELNPDFAGRPVVEDGREVYHFSSMLHRPVEFLSKGYLEKVYKLIRLKFVPIEGEVRVDTSKYFDKLSLSLIVDSATEFLIPPVMYGHYGHFRIEYELLNDNLMIRSHQEHSDLVSYTHKMLTLCMWIGKVSRDQFKVNCLFYFAVLNGRGNIDYAAMRDAFGRPYNYKFQVDDIVKIPYHLDSQEEDRREKNRIFLVKSIRHDLSPNSTIPNMKRTFLQLAELKYGRQDNTPKVQPILELMPISKEFATSCVGKKIEVLHATQSVFMMSSQLELLTRDSSSVMQAFYLPEMLYKLYLGHMTARLDSGFNLTSLQADIYAPEQQVVEDGEQAERDDQSVASMETKSQAGEPLDQNEERENGDVDLESDDDDGGDDEGSDDDDDDNEDDESLDGDSTNTDYSSDVSPDEEFASDLQLKEMVTKRSLEFNPERKTKPESWDFREYNSSDLKTMECEVKTSHQPEPRLWDAGPEKLVKLMSSLNEMDAINEDIVTALRQIKVKFLADTPFLGEDLTLGHDLKSVDHSCQPPIYFDRRAEPFKVAPRQLALIEALTQRRALEHYSLEGLENIGDSFLKYVVSVVLFKALKDCDEGALTSARSTLTCNEIFTHLARQSRLGSYAITRPFDKGLLCDLLNGARKSNTIRLRPKELADLFEALVGCHLVYGSEYEALVAIQALGLTILRDDMFSERHKGAVSFARCPTALLDDLAADTRQYYDSCKHKLDKFEQVLGYSFSDKSYLIQALTHGSWTHKCTQSYERLEYLGDSILDFLVTITLFASGKVTSPGQLTSSRSQLVNNVSFARLAIKYRYDLFLLYANHQLYDELTKVKLALEEDPDVELDMCEFDQITKLLGDIFESVAGAIYLDSGCSLDSLWGVYYPMLKEQIEREVDSPTKNKRVVLYEAFTGAGHIQFDSRINAEGSYVAQCKIVGWKTFEGTGASLRQAKTRAIDKVLQNLPAEEKIKELNRKFLEDHPPPVRSKPSRGTNRGGRGGGRGARGPRGSSRGRGGGGGGRGASRGGSRGGGRRDFRPPVGTARGGFRGDLRR